MVKIFHSVLSIINYGGIFLQNLLRFFIEFAGHFMNLVFYAADCAAHTDSSTHAVDFKFAGTFLTLHDLTQ